MYIVNKRLLVILAVTVVCLGVTVHWVHGIQNRRHAGFFLRRAHQAKTQSHTDDAVREYLRYLRVSPQDADARAELGLLLAEKSRYAEAFPVLEEALRLLPDRQDVRRSLIDVAMHLRRVADAEQHLQMLMKSSPDDPELLELLAAARAASGHDSAAVEALETAIQKDPHRLKAYAMLAELLRGRLDRAEEADRRMDEMIKANPSSAEAFCLRGRYRLQTDKARQAADDARQALALAPASPDALLLAAQCASEEGRFEEACGFGRRCLEKQPEHTVMRLVLADAELRRGDLEAAVTGLRQGLELNREHPALLHTLATVLLAGGRTEEAAATIQRLEATGCHPSLIDFLKASLAYSKKDWKVARDRFEQVRTRLSAFPDLAKQAEYRLAECYERLGQRDLQLAAARRAIAVDRTYVPARLKAAELLAEAGEIDEALAMHRETMRAERPPAAGWLLWVRLLLADVLRREPAARNWSELEAELKRMPTELADSAEGTILRAEILVAQGKAEGAEGLLAEARRQTPARIELWDASLALAERCKAWEQVNTLWEEATRHCGDCVPLRLARIRQAGQREVASIPRLVDELSVNTDGFSREDRLRLWRGLLAQAVAHKALPQARRICERIVEQAPDDLETRLHQIDLAWRQGDHDGLKAVLDAVHRLEGESPLWHYGEALRLQSAAKNGSKGLMAEASRHLAEARQAKPNWALPWLAAAAIHHEQGEVAQALEEYQQAIELGVRDSEVIRRTVHLLCQRQRHDEANQLLQRMESQQPGITTTMGRVASELRLRQSDLSGALAAARQTAKESTNPQDHLWLGQILRLASMQAATKGQSTEATAMQQEAESELRRGLELDRNNPSAWVLLIALLAGTGRSEQAAALLEEAQRDLQGENRLLTLAQCHKAIGDLEEADACYRKALADRPDDPVVLRSVAEFCFQQSKLPQAAAALESMLRRGDSLPAQDRQWARRTLAAVLLQQGGYPNLCRAVGLVDANLQSPQATNEDQCVKALLLASHPRRAERSQAARILEEALRQDRGLVRYRLLAAQVYQALGDWGTAARHLRAFLASNPSDAAALATYVQGMLQRGEVQEAADWLDRLERIAPNSPATQQMRLVWLLKRGQYEDLLQRLKTLEPAKAKEDAAAHARQVAALLENLAPTVAEREKVPEAAPFIAAAEEMLRELATSHPAEAMALANWLARRGRMEEALGVVENHWQQSEPAPLQRTLLQLQTPCLNDPDLAKRLLSITKAVGEKFHRPVSLVLMQAQLQIALGDYATAEQCYREALGKQPSNIIAANNLAVLLALQKRNLEEALQLISQVIQQAGPVATLLDSRAIVHLARGEPQKALGELEAAIADYPAPIHYFHSAQARDRLKDPEAAKAAFRKAEQLAGGAVEVHPLELPEYRRLRSLFSAG